MKIASVAALAVLVAASACHSSSSSGGADPAPTAAPAPGSPATAEKADKTGDLPSLADFEGQIDLVAKGAPSSAPVPLSLLVKNETLRIDAPQELLDAHEAKAFTGGGKVYAIIKPADKKTFVVLDAKRQAIALDLDTLGQQAKSLRAAHGGGGDTPTEAPPKVVKTGRKEMVAGYSCEDWDVTSAKSKATVCVAEKGASFFHFPSLGIPTEQAWALELVDGKHFPLKAVGFAKDGTEEGRVEVTKIDKHSLDASMFEVPMGYKQVTIEELMSGAIPSDGPHGGLPHAPHGKHHKH
jgi:hypothetical protein